MILTTDALIGGSLIVALIGISTPQIFKQAEKIVQVRQDMTAEAVSARCNAAAILSETFVVVELPDGVTADNTCGPAGETVTLTFPNTETRTVTYTNGLYRVGTPE